MKFHYNLDGSESIIVRHLPAYGAAADIVAGAVGIRGATEGTNGGYVIVGSSALTDAIGVLASLFDYSVNGDSAPTTGLTLVKAEVIVNPNAVYEAEYDQTDTLAPTSASSSTQFNCTSIEQVCGGWLYVVADSAASSSIGQLRFIVAKNTNLLTTMTAFDPVTDTTATLIKVLPYFAIAAKINATGKIGSDAAAGSGRVGVLASYIRYDGVAKTELSSVLHNGLLLTGLHPIFSADLILTSKFSCPVT